MSFAQIKDGRLLEDRRKLGAFYTPAALSQVIADWAIKDSQDTILEPSFGGCGFLQAARDRLSALGNRAPREHIYGCDIDPIAFDFLSQSLGTPVDLVRFVKGDFLEVETPLGWPIKFSSVLANPPYIPYQQIGTEQRARLMEREWPVKGAGGRSSLWVYFLLHALSFLERGGRMAWVLPGAFLQADYAQPIRAFLSEEFSRAAVFVLRERVFLAEGADEETVILLADGYQHKPTAGGLEIGAVASIAELRSTLAAWDDGGWSGASARRPANLDMDTLALAFFEDFAASTASKTLGSIATVQVGLVTGANEFFVLDEASRKLAGLKRRDCRAILSKFHAAKGLEFTRADHSASVRAGGRAHLIDAGEDCLNPRLSAYFSTFDPDRRQTISTFKKRRVWTQPDDRKIPDAFLPVMHHTGPRLVLNPDQMTCTNTIHRVYFDKLDSNSPSMVAISLLTSFSQLSAELVGRRYGSGVLKHEPREAEKIKLLLPPLSDDLIAGAFKSIDAALRSGDSDQVTQMADALVYPALNAVNWAEISARFRETLAIIRDHRRPDRSKWCRR